MLMVSMMNAQTAALTVGAASAAVTAVLLAHSPIGVFLLASAVMLILMAIGAQFLTRDTVARIWVSVAFFLA